MSLTKSQVALLSKWAKGGRMYIGFAVPAEELPEWAKLEFRLARELVRLAVLGERAEAERAVKRHERAVSRETARQIRSLLAKAPIKARRKDYRAAAIKAAATRKRQVAARAAEAERGAA